MNLPSVSKLSTLPIFAPDKAIFLKEKHVSYWLRCLRSLLPHQYTQSDSNRMTLAFFVLSALDLLDVLFTKTTSKERADWTDWIYTCQSLDGGFCGYPLNPQSTVWNPSSVPATYFALGALSILRDDLTRLKRRECLSWLRKTQRIGDGSFGELLGENGHIEGGWDSRYGYCAMVVRWILRDNIIGDVEGVPDVDVEALFQCIRKCETYDGGLSDRPFHEAHAGYTYCAIGTLAFLNRLPTSESHSQAPTNGQSRATSSSSLPGLASKQRTVRWLLSCLTTLIEEDELDDGEDRDSLPELSNIDRDNSLLDTIPLSAKTSPASKDAFAGTQEPSFIKLRSTPVAHAEPSSPKVSHKSVFDPPNSQYTAFSGRINKYADTCYAFWVGASLKMLNSLQLIEPAPLQRFLLDKAQHVIAGGFGKSPTDPPDIYHSYLALAILSILEDEDVDEKVEGADGGTAATAAAAASSSTNQQRPLARLDAPLCMSVRAKEWIQSLEWRKCR